MGGRRGRTWGGSESDSEQGEVMEAFIGGSGGGSVCITWVKVGLRQLPGTDGVGGVRPARMLDDGVR